jgi:hypothetical protein
MKTLALTFALALASAGCLGNFVPNPQPGSGPADMAGTTGTGGNGNGGSAGSGGGGSAGAGGSGGGGGESNGSSTDMAITHVVSTDMAGQTAGTAAFGASCTVNSDCQSLLCEPFVMGTVHRCTKTCTVATEATDCPAPSAGTCTNNGYCKFNQ